MIREATGADIPAMHTIRMAVKENRLNNPALVTLRDYEEYIERRGKGWVLEHDDHIRAFAIIDIINKNVWALFVEPAHEKKGYGNQLQQVMLDWYFKRSGKPVWLSTAPGTRAERFYRNTGWAETGLTLNGEIRFEMTKKQWEKTFSE